MATSVQVIFETIEFLGLICKNRSFGFDVVSLDDHVGPSAIELVGLSCKAQAASFDLFGALVEATRFGVQLVTAGLHRLLDFGHLGFVAILQLGQLGFVASLFIEHRVALVHDRGGERAQLILFGFDHQAGRVYLGAIPIERSALALQVGFRLGELALAAFDFQALCCGLGGSAGDNRLGFGQSVVFGGDRLGL